jgi:hypothetical protein
MGRYFDEIGARGEAGRDYRAPTVRQRGVARLKWKAAFYGLLHCPLMLDISSKIKREQRIFNAISIG